MNISRNWIYTQMQATQPLVIIGESGSGKSALVSNWIKEYQKKNRDEFIITHFIGASPYSTAWEPMLRRIMDELKKKLYIRQEIPRKSNELKTAFSNWLYMAAAKRKIILIIDALDKIEDKGGAPDLVWLPPVMPENVRLILSTLPGRSLDEIQKRKWQTMSIETLSFEERRELIDKQPEDLLEGRLILN